MRQENERLQRLVSTKSLNSSQSSLQVNPVESMDRRLSAADVPGPMSMGKVNVFLDYCLKIKMRIFRLW